MRTAQQPVGERLARRPWRSKAVTAAGLSRHELSGPLWRHPHRGVVAWAGLDDEDPAQRVMAAAVALPGVALGGWAAAYLLGASEFDGARGDGELLPVVFCPGESGARRRRHGLVPLRSKLAADDVVTVKGIHCTSAARTAFDLARMAADLGTAVADVDTLLRVPAIPLDVKGFSAYVDDHPGMRGVRRLRQVTQLVDPAARSRPESVLRVLWVTHAGLPRPLVNRKVFDRRSGRLLGIPDLLDPETGLVAEYDGAQHREIKQHTDDNAREERLENCGLTVVRFSARDLWRPAQVAARLKAGHERALRERRREWRVLG